MTSDLELWDRAHRLMEEHGEWTALFVAERIRALTAEGDIDGAAIWKAIAARIYKLSSPRSGVQ